MAQQSGELVRLAIADGEHLTWVAKSQGARKGLRYDPDIGTDERLSCTATGHAWLLTLSDECALDLVSGQGFGATKDYGPKVPTTVQALLKMLHAACERGQARAGRDQHRRAAHAAQRRAHAAIGAGAVAGRGRSGGDARGVGVVREAAAREGLALAARRRADGRSESFVGCCLGL